jgi:hypothetical protein
VIFARKDFNQNQEELAMKCPICQGQMATMTVYGITYHKCEGTNTYFDSSLNRIENILEYKNAIRRKALKEYYKITELDDEDKE